MANMLLTIQNGKTVFSPPVKDGVQIEWERTGSPGKLTFTTVKVQDGSMSFNEGDRVCFYYDDKPVFMGYVFKKKRDRENHIEVVCYDQIRYLKNKYTYAFENKTATEIVKALCEDFGLQVGQMDNTSYVIPAIAEENKSALDIILTVLEETLSNTGNMFVLQDNFGKLQIKNCANMVSTNLIMEDTAENYDYTSSIDDETYNNVILYYKEDDNQISLYTAYSPSTTKKWGILRYFEEVDTKTAAQNKANNLLKMYNSKTRELKITGAFGDISVRGGTLIPVRLNLGDTIANNHMLVEKVTHIFNNGHYTMDLTLQGKWEDGIGGDIVSKSIEAKPSGASVTTSESGKKIMQYTLRVDCNGIKQFAGTIDVVHTDKGISKTTRMSKESQFMILTCDENTIIQVVVKPYKNLDAIISTVGDNWLKGRYVVTTKALGNYGVIVKWVRGQGFNSGHDGGGGFN